MPTVNVRAFTISGRVELDAKAAHKEMQGLESDSKSLTKAVDLSARSFSGLKEQAERHAKSTRQALALAYREGKGNIGGLVREARQAQRQFEALEKAETKAARASSGRWGGFSRLAGGGGFGAGAGAAAGTMAGNLLTGGARALFGHVTEAIDKGMEMKDLIEQMRIGFTSLTGSEQKAVMHMRELFQFGADTPFQTRDILEYSQALQAVGAGAGEVRGMLTDLGDAAAKAGSFGKMPQAVKAVTDMLGKGTVQAEEMRGQLSEAIPGAIGYMARALEMSQEEFNKRMEAGGINAAAAIRLMFAQMRKEAAGSMKAIAQETIAGLESTKEDAQLMLYARGVAGGDPFGKAAGAYAQRRENLKEQINLYSGPQSEKMAQKIGGSAETYYSAIGHLEKNAFASDWFTDLLHGNPDGAKAKLKTLGSYIPAGLGEGVRDGAKTLTEAVNGTLGVDLWSGLTGFWETHSPSERTIRLGKWVSEGFEIGLEQGGKGKLGTSGKPYDSYIKEAAAKYGVDPNLIRAVIKQESGFKRDALSPMGAKGLMQLMDGTARRFGVTNSFDPRQNIMGGTAYLAELIREFKDLRLALAAYNAGEGAVRANLPNRPDVNSYVGGSGKRWTVSEAAAQRAQGIPRNGQTPEYVATIMRDYTAAVGGNTGAVNELSARVRDLAASTNWRTREGIKPLPQLTEAEGIQALMGFPGFKEFWAERQKVYGRGDLTGGTGVFVEKPMGSEKPAGPVRDFARDKAQIQGIFDSVREGDETLKKMIVEMEALPHATFSAGAGMFFIEQAARQSGEGMVKSTYTIADAIGRSVSKIDSLMGSFGQMAGMMPQGQQVGKKRSWLSKALGIASPFLNFIPGVGPILSLAAGIGSRALAGDYAGAIMGAAGGFSSGGAFRSTGGSSNPPILGSPFRNISGGAGSLLTPSVPVDGRREFGGPVSKGRTYIVGEHRAEVFSPDEDGFIHPSMDAYGRSRGAGGGGSQGRGMVGGVLAGVLAQLERHAAAVEQLHGKIGSMSAGDVLTAGARTPNGQKAIAQGWQAGASRDPKTVEWMQRRMEG